MADKSIAPEVRKYMSELGKKGAAERSKRLSAQRRKRIARMGGLAKAEKYRNRPR